MKRAFHVEQVAEGARAGLTAGMATGGRDRARFDLGRTVAVAWIIVAVGVTVTIGPSLGWRGWMWLGLHDLLCAVGAGHELWRKRNV